jgi:serine/threonine-protein kinase
MQPGEIIGGKYRLIRLLGDGGMGSVFEALHEKLGTRVAIKFLHAELARRAGLGERFLQEARVAAQIKNPHVVQVTDTDQTADGVAYIVMELLEGEPLSGVLERQGKLGVPTSCEYTRQILEALEAAHAIGVIHRDLKPENVFVTYVSGKASLKLIDFGIAKLKNPLLTPSGAAGAGQPHKNLTVAGVLMGTAEYMAPEQAFSADKVDARSDLYSVGVMLYEMIAGQRPVTGDDARVIALKVERGEITPLVHAAPDVPREIAGLVHRAMASRPELRFATASEMRSALEGALSGKRPPTVPLPADPRRAAAKTGTVMGAPADALLTPMPPAPGQAHGPQTAIGSGTDRVAPVAIVTPNPSPAFAAYEAGPRARRSSSRGWLIALLALLGAVAVGAIVVSQYDVFGGSVTPDPTPTATAQNPAPPPPGPAPTANPAPAAAKPGDTLAPLVQPPPSPRPQPTPRPHPSGGASPSPSGATPDAPPPLPSFPPFPFPIPSTVPSMPFPIPSLPLPIPGFGPPVQPAPAPTASSASSLPGY